MFCEIELNKMVVEDKYLEGRDFVKAILEDEREFRNVRLRRDFNLNTSGPFNSIQKYLRAQDLEHKPFHFYHTEFRGLIARGLYMPYTISRYSDFTDADFSGANFFYSLFQDNTFLIKVNLQKANLEGVDFSSLENGDSSPTSLEEANLTNANLRGANLEGTYCEGTIFRGADLYGVRLFFTHLCRANLKGVKNLGETIDLQHIIDGDIIITAKEEPILKKALASKIRYKVEK